MFNGRKLHNNVKPFFPMWINWTQVQRINHPIKIVRPDATEATEVTHSQCDADGVTGGCLAMSGRWLCMPLKCTDELTSHKIASNLSFITQSNWIVAEVEVGRWGSAQRTEKTNDEGIVCVIYTYSIYANDAAYKTNDGCVGCLSVIE